MFGIKDYRPEIYTDSFSIMKDYKERLESLKGKSIKEIWAAEEQTSGEWFPDCPVIICFDECQIELCAYKQDEFLLSFDTISVSQPIDWYGTDFVLAWEKNKLFGLDFAVNQQIQAIEVIEICERGNSRFCYLYGFGFQISNGSFAVCNGFDENKIIIGGIEDPYAEKIII